MPLTFWPNNHKPTPDTELFSQPERPSAAVKLSRGREKPVLNRHPWIFSGAIKEIEPQDPAAGDLVNILDYKGRWLAVGMYSPESQIRVRILSWDRNQQIDRDFWYHRLNSAVKARSRYIDLSQTNAFRLVNAESDLLPGLIVDKYGDFVVLQCLVVGIDRRKQDLASMFMEMTDCAGVFERSDVAVRKHEGLRLEKGRLAGQEPPKQLTILESGHKLIVDLSNGQKTGLYLDQRENKPLVCSPVNTGQKDVLNCFSYTGSFSVVAAAAGAKSITNVDESTEALTAAKLNMKVNRLDNVPTEYVVGDAFKILREYRDADRRFDLIILDPPKFAHAKSQIQAACRGYKDLNWLALRLLRSDGILATFSCSGLVDEALFQKVLFAASIDSGRNVQIIKRLNQGLDHPVLASFPEAAYLKGFLCRVL